MKTIMKIEIALLVIVLLVAAGMILVSDGVLGLLKEPELIQREPVQICAEEIISYPAATEPAEAYQSQKETDPRVLTATKYFAYDLREEEYLLQVGNGDEKLYPASITKLLTSYVVLQYMKPEAKVTATDALNLVALDSSLAKLEEGDVLTVEQLIAAMMLPSGNDAAQVAAVAAGRAIAENEALDYTEAAKVFVEEMNRQAKALGMENSHFVSPDGYHDDNHYTSMNDLVTLCKTVLKNPTILKYTGMAKSTVTLSGRELEWENTNILLDSEKEFYHPNTIGMKTGYTSKAGNCLVSAFFMEDRLLLIGVFGCPAFTDDRYLDTLAIYNNL